MESLIRLAASRPARRTTPARNLRVVIAVTEPMHSGGPED
jgi:hypothetical protein